MDDFIASGNLSGTQVIIWDIEESRRIYKLGYYGKPSGIRKPKSFDFNRPLELDLLESVYLVRKGIMQVKEGDKILSDEDLKERATQYYQNFSQQYSVYEDLKEKKYVVRPGLKFGTDFAVYHKGPGKDHSSFVVHIIASNVEPIHLVRAGRLATSVKKRYVIATVLNTGLVRYYIFSWYKP